MATGSHEKNYKKEVMYWYEKARNAVERDSPTAILWKESKKLKLRIIWSEMARNAIESDFQSSKMVAGGHFVKNNQNKKKVAYWSEMAGNAQKVIFSHPKWRPFCEKIYLKKTCVLIWNEIESDFQ